MAFNLPGHLPAPVFLNNLPYDVPDEATRPIGDLGNYWFPPYQNGPPSPPRPDEGDDDDDWTEDWTPEEEERRWDVSADLNPDTSSFWETDSDRSPPELDQDQKAFTEERIRRHLKTARFVADDGGSPEICAVCQEEYEGGATVGILQCRHRYHADCITKWLLGSNGCPVCKGHAWPMTEQEWKRYLFD